MKLRYTPQAIADIREVRDYIRDILHNPAAAERVTRSILDGFAALKQFPEMGISLAAKTGFETDLRMLVCGRYIALYRIDQDAGAVSVARIIHAQQDYVRILLNDVESVEQEEASE